MENISVKFERLDGNELILREGKALDQKEPLIFSHTGDLKNVNNYLSKRDQEGTANYVDPNNALVIVNRAEMSVTLKCDPNNPYAQTVTGKLQQSDEVQTFSINSNKTYSREEIVKLLRFNKMYFDNPETHAKILEAFQKLDLSTSGNVGASSDNRGNKDISFKKTVTSNIPHSFALNIPIFKGFEPRKILVEVCVDVTESKAIFWLESVELSELIQQEVNTLIEAEINALSDKYIVLYQ